MAINVPFDAVEIAAAAEARAGWWGTVLDFARRRPLGAAGAAVVIFLILLALSANLVAPYNPVAVDFGAMLSRPNAAHWLGTDAFGRDVLTRLIYGSRTALFVGFGAAVVGSTLGAILGVGSAFFGGKVDLYLQRLMDCFIAFPLSIREMPYVDAARAAGFGNARIIMRHMLPNVMAPYLIMLTSFLGQAILLEASLSFLGLGVQEPTAAWGLMLRGAAVDFAESAPWMAVFPGLAISLAVFAFNLFGDSLRDALDPKLRTL